MRLTKEREAQLRAFYEREHSAGSPDEPAGASVRDLLAELDAVRAERDALVRALDAKLMPLDAARADERAKVVAWLRGMRRRDTRDALLRDIADAIEHGEHEVKP